MTLSPSRAFCNDIGGGHSGAVSVSMNMVGNIGAPLAGLPHHRDWVARRIVHAAELAVQYRASTIAASGAAGQQARMCVYLRRARQVST